MKFEVLFKIKMVKEKMNSSDAKRMLLTVKKNHELRIIGYISLDMDDLEDLADEKPTNPVKWSKFKMAVATLKEFCAETTVHGVRYIAKQKRHWIERIWWIIAFVLSAGFCTFAICNIWLQRQDHPVIVSLDDKMTPVGQIPFPAVTICPTQKFLVKRIDIEHFERLLNASFDGHFFGPGPGRGPPPTRHPPPDTKLPPITKVPSDPKSSPPDPHPHPGPFRGSRSFQNQGLKQDSSPKKEPDQNHNKGPNENQGPQENHDQIKGPQENHDQNKGPQENRDQNKGPQENHDQNKGPQENHEQNKGPEENHGPDQNPFQQADPNSFRGRWYGNNDKPVVTMTPNEANKLNALHQTCFRRMGHFHRNLKLPVNESIYKTIKDISPWLDFTSFTMFVNSIHVSMKFKPVFTSQGLCFTFNSLNSDEIFTDQVTPELLTVRKNPIAKHWNIESGYNASANDSEVYPYRVYGASARDVLYLELALDIGISHMRCKEQSQGFLVQLHSPDSLPSDDFIRIPADQEVYISVKPQMMTTSNGLRGYSPEKRGCFFKSERKLRFFKMYSQQNCELECIADYLKKRCGCVQFSMPCDNSTNICTMLEYQCLEYGIVEFSKYLMVKNCTCLPECTSLTYDVEVSQAPVLVRMESGNTPRTVNRDDVGHFVGYKANSKLCLVFKQPYFIGMNRSESFTLTNVIASCGGIMGLFMGISILSVVELIYFFTLRMFCTLKKHKNKQRSPLTWAEQKSISVIHHH